MVNRQLRRAEEKKERKAEREKERAKVERLARRDARRKARQAARMASRAKPRGAASDGGSANAGKDTSKAREGAPRQSNPGRFSGVLTAATIFFIALQTAAPTDGTIPSQLVSASFYLLYGYFATLWMLRRDASRVLTVTTVGGGLMALVTLLSQWLQADLAVQPIMLALTLPLTIAGANLGRIVWDRAP